MFPRMALSLTTLLIIPLAAIPAGALDLDTNAFVDIVEGITIGETLAMTFGDVALNDGTITINTDGSVSDPNLISFDATGASQGAFSITSIAGGAYDIVVLETIPVAGLLLDNFQISIDGAGDEAGSDTFVGVTLTNAVSTLDVGGDLTVDSALAVVGDNQSIGYRVQVNFN